ncbi:adenylosuccinate synthetase [Butyrivibrio sp. LB2008]|uniref:adenylosuccinate synthetase n=1 Tax=Butyrivibrio sp. LB2008 TaxID=1408305 RepID=UPI000685C3BD|nr:adenylosuccinate synthetase [Butyrivibrio sp. LB2008]
MRTVAVIGKNFGDEGKGLVCASLSKNVKNTLIVKHNGGGQAGHTVESEDGKRFIHHQIGSGAEHGAATLLADTFMVDLYQLTEELSSFEHIYGFIPEIYAEKNTHITVIDDVLRNMFIESARGPLRHGSCGMGINECKMRQSEGFSLTLEEVRDLNPGELFRRLKRFRIEYGQRDIEALKAKFKKNNPGEPADYYDMLTDDGVLFTYVKYLKEGIRSIKLVDASKDWLSRYDQIVFETGQGLLLDEDYTIYAPHLTPSKTGLHNIAQFLEKREMPLNEFIYVTRPYVTRHGNGPLPHELKREELPGVGKDSTNMDNEWQGSIRYAKHESFQSFDGPVRDDVKSVLHMKCMRGAMVSVLLTHLDETNDIVYFQDGDIHSKDLMKTLLEDYGYTRVYTSHSRFGTDMYK